MPTLEVLVGMIASGKSTYARKRADEGALVISHDDLTEMLHARYRYEDGLREVYRGIEKALAVEILLSGRDVIIDRTHLTRESRARWVRFARATIYRPRIVAVVFPVESPGVHAERRFESDSRGRPWEDWVRVALHHHAQYLEEPIKDDEGFDEIKWINGISGINTWE